jgi:hypothetical protein
MDRSILLSLLFISLTACLDKTQPSTVEATIAKPTDTTTIARTEIYNDSTITLFGDSSYKLTLQTFDTANNYDAERNNTVLILSKQDRNQIKVLFRDSLFCMYPDIDFQDYNNDKIKDVLVFYYTGARANPTYHLYLTNLKNHNLIRVKGFEELPNPALDTTNNIITSIALSGTNYYSFYRINTQNKLIDLGHRYEENPNDSTQYEKAIRKILKKHK